MMTVGSRRARPPRTAENAREGDVRRRLLLVHRGGLCRTQGREGVTSGYIGGQVPNPDYKQVCTGLPATPRRSSGLGPLG